MQKYVAFLRGINVGKSNRISMANLKKIAAAKDPEFETLYVYFLDEEINSDSIKYLESYPDSDYELESLKIMRICFAKKAFAF